MLRYISVVAVLLVASSRASAEVKVGEPPPDIRLDALLPNQPVANATLHALAGKAVVLEFWATWCKPCVAAIPDLNELVTQFNGRPVVFLSVTDEEQPKVEAFLQKHPINGWVGIANTIKLNQAYGVRGIPQAFLIDAKGKLAGALNPSQLSAVTMEDLLAGRPVPFDVFAPPDFSIKRSEEGAGPKPLLDILVRPSSDTESKMMWGPTTVRMDATTLSRIISWSHEFWNESRIEGDPALLTATYDLSISLPVANVQERTASVQHLRAIVHELIPVTFKVKVSRETKDKDVYVLTAPNGKPAALVEATGPRTWETDNGKFEVAKCNMTQLAMYLESVLGRPVVDETGLSGEYDMKLKYDGEPKDGLLDALKNIGLNVDPARRPIEFLVVTKAQ